MKFDFKSIHAFTRFWATKSWSESPHSSVVRVAGSVSEFQIFPNLNWDKIYDFILEIIDFTYFYFDFIKNHNNTDFLKYNLGIIIYLLKF